MNFGTLYEVATSGRLGALHSLLSIGTAFYRLHFLVAMARQGILQALAEGPKSAQQLAELMKLNADAITALVAWLEVGIAVKELSLRDGKYRLHSKFGRTLAMEKNDDLLAVLEEIQDLHARLISQTPQRLMEGRPFTLAEQDGKMIARSSRVLEPFVREAIMLALPKQGALRILEVGCGSGVYLRFMADKNSEASMLGLELQPEVAETARKNLAKWGVDSRASVEAQDIRERPAGELFDLVTLHNNIYYFEEANRTALLRQLLGQLKPGGTLLVTTACRGASPAMSILNLWGAVTQGCGRLPSPKELCAQLREAGGTGVKAIHIGAPLDAFYAFTCVK